MPALLAQHAPKWVPYRALNGKTLRQRLADEYGIKVPSTGNRWPVDQLTVRDTLAGGRPPTSTRTADRWAGRVSRARDLTPWWVRSPSGRHAAWSNPAHSANSSQVSRSTPPPNPGSCKLDSTPATYPPDLTPPRISARQPNQAPASAPSTRKHHRDHWTDADSWPCKLPEPRWAVPGRLCGGFNLLAGAPKLDKS